LSFASNSANGAPVKPPAKPALKVDTEKKPTTTAPAETNTTAFGSASAPAANLFGSKAPQTPTKADQKAKAPA